jgi:hypothetical protein
MPKSRRENCDNEDAGAVRAGWRHITRIAELEKVAAGTDYSTSRRRRRGDRMLVGWIHKPRGTGSRMRTPHEGSSSVIVRARKCEIDGVESLAPRALIFVPANAAHHGGDPVRTSSSSQSRICRRYHRQDVDGT